ILHLLTRLSKEVQSEDGGTASDIYRGKYNNREMCVKVPRIIRKKNMRILRTHAKDFALSCSLSHPNILPFYGIYVSQENSPRICIVSLWMANGDLVDFLEAEKPFPKPALVHLIADVAAGLHYLHKLEIVHADLKGKNILVSHTGRAVIADFGISRVIKTNYQTTEPSNGTLNWMAPELLTGGRGKKPTTWSDIWAFGCVCYEVYAGEAPFSEYENFAQMASACHDHALNIPTILPVMRGTPGEEDRHTWNLMLKCWNYEPTSRPTSKELSESIAVSADDQFHENDLILSTLVKERSQLATKVVANKCLRMFQLLR
ncbi:Mitogen-activated protein kinase kinase kinase 12, partial [Leucoagaricus sp. SymC.cos]